MNEIAPIETLGPCGKSYKFKPEYSETWVQCPDCKKTFQVPEKPDFKKMNALEKYLHKRQQQPIGENKTVLEKNPWQKIYEMTQIDWLGRETYILQEKGQREIICHADRQNYFANALVLGALVWLLGCVLILSKLIIVSDVVFYITSTIGFLLLGGWGLAVLLRYKYYKRDVHFYNDERMTDLLFSIADKNTIEFPSAHFDVLDKEGNRLATLKKSWIHDVFRARWDIDDEKGSPLFYCTEQSAILALMRRMFFSKLFWFRINFTLKNYKTEKTMGEFTRSWKIHDHYTLDLSLNSEEIDVRVFFALSVLLDSAERR